jgi:antagonist of KipI
MSDMVTLEFLKTGLLTSVQDLGRSGWQQFGVPISGAMDRPAMLRANQLVGNKKDSPCLEITLLGPKIKIHGEGQMALTGADLSAKLNEERINVTAGFSVREGDVLSFGRCISGCRAYLAVAGEWQVARWLGSCSEVPYTKGMAGLPCPLEPGRIISISNRKYSSSIPYWEAARPFTLSDQIRIMAGPEFTSFSEQTIADFMDRRHVVSSQSNRMGYRLESPLKYVERLPELISSGVVPGTIQITGSGQPIILMMDAQTTGGYHRIANVVESDLPILAQMKPGDPIKFIWV